MLRSWHDILQNNLEREYKSLTSCVCCTSLNVFLLPWSFSSLSSLNAFDIYIQCKRGNVNEIFSLFPQLQFISKFQNVWQAIPKYIPLHNHPDMFNYIWDEILSIICLNIYSRLIMSEPRFNNLFLMLMYLFRKPKSDENSRIPIPAKP